MANRHKAQAFARGGGAKKKEPHPEHEREVEHEAGLKRGGHTKRATGGKVPGFKSGGRLDKRARGGGVGADRHPFSSAHIGHKRGGHAGK